LHPGKPAAASAAESFGLLEPLLEAARSELPLERPMQSIVKALGFDHFMYGMSTDSRPNRDSRSYVWTTLPQAWVAFYDRNSLIEIDPRITQTVNRTSPLLWDSAAFESGSDATRFFQYAERFGIRSGVVVSFRDPDHARIVVALNSSISPVDEAREVMIKRHLGEIMLLATSFHDVFMSQFYDRGVPPRQQGVPLSPREQQCLQMAARGLTSNDIATKLGIAERTIHFHFSNILSKMGALNRQEAVAKGIAGGVIQA
jgi:DNA-binding CsgD family transcriptional regulator